MTRYVPFLAFALGATLLLMLGSAPQAQVTSNSTMPPPTGSLSLATAIDERIALTSLSDGALLGPGIVRGAPGANAPIVELGNTAGASGGVLWVTVMNLGDVPVWIDVPNGAGVTLVDVGETAGAGAPLVAGNQGVHLRWAASPGTDARVAWVVRKF